jgi:hypothetical protein
MLSVGWQASECGMAIRPMRGVWMVARDPMERAFEKFWICDFGFWIEVTPLRIMDRSIQNQQSNIQNRFHLPPFDAEATRPAVAFKECSA